MSTVQDDSALANNHSVKKRGKPKGRVVDLNALVEIKALLGNEPRERDLLIEHLHKIQDEYGHLSAAHQVAPAEVYEVASFYHYFDTVRENDSAPPALTVRV